MKKVLLTGATGYIGQFAVRYLLAKNYVIHAVSSKPIEQSESSDLIWHRADLLNEREAQALVEKTRPTHLLHFAWYVEHGKFWNAPENLEWLRASLFLAEQFVKCGGKRMVAAGTCAEYDWTQRGALAESSTDFKPQTLYGTAKAALAQTLEKYAKTAHFSFASGKIFFPFGANEAANRLVPSITRSLLENRLARTSHGRQIRDFLHVEDVAEAFTALLESDARGAVNIASGKGVELKEIIETIAETIGKPEFLRIGALKAAPDEPPEIVADVTRLRDEVGFAQKENLSARLRQTVEYWKNNL